MKTILTFDGQDIETLSREDLIAAVWELAEENKRLTAAANRGVAARVEEYKRQASQEIPNPDGGLAQSAARQYAQYLNRISRIQET